jgi:hypothetical protein
VLAFAVLATFFVPLAARAFKSAALASAAALPGKVAVALVVPAPAVGPCGAAGVCTGAGVFPVEAGAALPLFAAGGLAGDGLWDAVGCAAD